ncbi:MAG: class I SAM-dependent methyltransferase [Myxococcota bacterium]
MKECSKSIQRRLGDPGFMARYFRGQAIDIGGRPDPLSLYVELFPLLESVRVWDVEDGDAESLPGLTDEAFDLVHSSHCLEHLRDPRRGLQSWFRVLKPGGHLVVTVPDEDLYEQGRFPSTFNLDHKWTFTISKVDSWSDRSLNVLDLLKELGPRADVHRVQLLDAGYRYALPRYDQTLTPVGECGIEIVVRKRPVEEVEAGGRVRGAAQPDRETRIHLNQYRDDLAVLKRANAAAPPFGNDDEL